MLSIVKTLKEFCTILLGQQLKLFTDHKNLTCKKFNTDRVLWWKYILEEYSPEIEYILGKKSLGAEVLSRLSNNGNQHTTHESTYSTDTMPEIYDIDEPLNGMVPLSFKLIDRYQHEYSFLTEKLKCAKYNKGSFLLIPDYYRTCNVQG